MGFAVVTLCDEFNFTYFVLSTGLHCIIEWSRAFICRKFHVEVS